MAGFFGLFDYSKPGKGVRKDEPQKPRFLHFWELFFRKFWKLCQLNLLYLLFCLPVVTIGPATAGLTYVLRNLADEQPVFLFSDFWDAFRKNWKQALPYSLLMTVILFLITLAVQFYSAGAATYKWMFAAVVLALFAGLMLVLSSYYVMLMIVTLDLPLKAIIKNALILAIVRLKTNLLTLLFTGLLFCLTFLLLPQSFLVALFLPAILGFIICFNSYPGIRQYIIDPYMQAQQTPANESLFNDETPKSE